MEEEKINQDQGRNDEKMSVKYTNWKMPKDIVLSNKTFVISHATILILALLFFAGLYYILYQDKFQPNFASYTPVTKEPVSLFLEVSNPEDDTLVYDDNIIISGKTSPDLAVIITTNNTQAGLQSGKDGEFSKVLSLSPGVNLIEVTAFDAEGNTKSVTKSVFYSENKL